MLHSVQSVQVSDTTMHHSSTTARPINMLLRRMRSIRRLSYTISLPKGISDNSTSFRCCFANGIPIMVINSRQANTMCTNAVYQPPQSIQIMLKSTGRQPLLLRPFTTRLPNGHNTMAAILKHCKPNGMPIMVMHSTIPPIR